MPSVLITRPAADAEPLASRLQELNYETVIEPLLSIAPTAAPCPHVNAGGIVITSGNALRALEGREDDLAGLFDLPCFCVGSRTGEKARAFGFRRVQNAAGDGTELARFINNELHVKSATLLHIAGRDGDGKTQQELEAAGHKVTVWPVYEARPVLSFTPATRVRIEQRKLNAVLVFSPRTAQTLATLITGAALEACCKGLAAICLSEAVAEPLKPLGWRRLVAAPKPTEDSMIACLQDLCPATS